jgi:glycerol-3-phosphate acyltransferase PlsY
MTDMIGLIHALPLSTAKAGESHGLHDLGLTLCFRCLGHTFPLQPSFGFSLGLALLFGGSYLFQPQFKVVFLGLGLVCGCLSERSDLGPHLIERRACYSSGLTKAAEVYTARLQSAIIQAASGLVREWKGWSTYGSSR